MLNVFYIFIKSLISPIVGAVLTLIVGSCVSHNKTNDWREWFTDMPQIWITLLVFFTLWFIVIFLVQRRADKSKEQSKKNRRPFWTVIDEKPVGKIPYAGVNWIIHAPAGSDLNTLKANFLEISIPPRCPECKTEMDEKKSFLRGYTWKCVKCNFTKRNKDCFLVEAKRVKKIVKSDFEEYQSSITNNTLS
ncbi:MAG: hypothetical protein PHG35_04580 [Dehalococcoidales bacterium]|nr:hypothetical protein [Dehalococcoidales bacterium]